MVVAPYNDQVRSYKARLRTFPVEHRPSRHCRKFQVEKRPSCFYDDHSSADDMPRGPEFLFSRNRLNVAVSRARCLPICVHEELLNSRAVDIDDMLYLDPQRLRGVRPE